jgi:hypothetical protein
MVNTSARKTQRRSKNTLIVDTPAKLARLKKMVGNGKNTVSFYLIYAEWCGACHTFRKNIWDPSLNKPAIHNRIAVRDDIFNNMDLSKKVRDLKYLPSLIVVDEKGDVQEFESPEGPTNIMPTPKTSDDLMQAVNANVSGPPPAAVNNGLSKNVIVAANKSAAIANTAAKNAKESTVRLNNASANMIARAVANTRAAANNARKAANNARAAAENIKSSLNSMKTEAAAAAVVAAAAAAKAAENAEVAAEDAEEVVNSEEEEEANTNYNANLNITPNYASNNANANANAEAEENYNTNYNTNANTNAETNYNANTNTNTNTNAKKNANLVAKMNKNGFGTPPPAMIKKDGKLTPYYPTPETAPQFGGSQSSQAFKSSKSSKGNLLRMLSSYNTTRRHRR